MGSSNRTGEFVPPIFLPAESHFFARRTPFFPYRTPFLACGRRFLGQILQLIVLQPFLRLDRPCLGLHNPFIMKISTSLSSAVLLTLVLLLLVSCAGPKADGHRVLILGLDGMDPQTIDLLMSEGKLPNFAKLRQEGAYGKLRSQKPLLSPIIWTTIATGKGPEEHGIGHFVAVSETGEQLPATSSMRQVQALWNIASQEDRSVATVGWWATWPPESVNGQVVSDHTGYHFLFAEGFGDGEGGAHPEDVGGAKTHPPELLQRIEPMLRRPEDLSFDELTPYVNVTQEEFDRPFDFDNDLAHFKWALATAQSYRDIGLELWRTEQPDLGLMYIEGTDSTSHLFGHLFRAEGLGGDMAQQQEQFGGTVEAIYEFADRLLGDVVAALDDNTTLLVVSDHGFMLGELHDDPSRTRDLRRVSEKFHRIDGILYMYGRGVRAGARVDQASILDITPTALALLGLPPAQDMPGRVLDEAFRDPLSTTPSLARVATYEPEGGRQGGDGQSAAAISEAQLAHLRSLGYLGGNEGAAEPTTSSPQGDRNMAAIHFEAGRYRDAAKMYQQLVDSEPDDAALRSSFAGVLGALERYDLALEQLDRAIDLEPLSVEAFHNRAVIKERLGSPQDAVGDYVTALRYNPQYEPSRRALYRLTGQTDVRAPRSEAEAQASQLVQQASQAARKTNYEEALRLLDAAEQAAPGYVLVYQYRSNVAYLMGDLPLGIAALEKALEIEPDNALFERNLERLKNQAASGGS